MIRRAVMSYWSAPAALLKPCDYNRKRAESVLWALSALKARAHFDELVLVTDSPGAAWLAGELALPWTAVDTHLDSLDTELALIWALGKLAAHTRQDVPFVHLDYDVILWEPLPNRLLEAAVIAERPEPWSLGSHWLNAWYPLGELRRYFLPPDWMEAAVAPQQLAFNCGIVGGNDVAGLHEYATTSLGVAAANDLTLIGGTSASLILEQWALARQFGGAVEPLFPTQWPTTNAGYTHLYGRYKGEVEYRKKCERRLRKEFPDFVVPDFADAT